MRILAIGNQRPQMPKVTKKNGSSLFYVFVLLLFFQSLGSASIDSPPDQPVLSSAQALYKKLSNVGLDKTRVFHIRDAALDRASLRFTLHDGTIAFTEDVDGHITGAFFEGEGEVLLIPPGQVERGSMVLFTGGAILEEQFDTAFFRFNDDTFNALQSSLRAADDGQDFFTRWNETAIAMAQTDALRLFTTFSQMTPNTPEPNTTEDRYLHAHLQGRKLGGFDIYYDSRAQEQIWVGQLQTVKEQDFYNVWTSFSINGTAHGNSEAVSSTTGQDAPSEAIRITNYQIRAEVKPPTELDAEAVLQVQVARGGQRTVLFELSRFLQVKEVLADGKPVEFIHNESLEGTQLARRGNDVVAVVFSGPLKSGQQLELRFTYGGEVISQAGPGLLYVGERGNWYPNLGMAMSHFDLEFHYPEGWTLLATGKQIPITVKIAAGEQASRWVSEKAIPFAGFNLGKYAHGSASAHGIPIDAYATKTVEKAFIKNQENVLLPSHDSPKGVLVEIPPPLAPSPAKNVNHVAENAAQAVDFFSNLYGPYPFQNLKITQLPGYASQGWPGMIFLSTYAYLTDDEKAQIHFSPVERTMISMTVAHETAHQWWGDLVSWNGYRDQWLIEALANYSAMLLLREQNPAQFRAVLDRYRDDLLVKQEDGELLMDAGPVTLGTRLSNSKFPAGYEAISYGRGTWLFFMLDSMVRDGERLSGKATSQTTDDLFVKTLRQITEKYAGKTITTKDVIAAFVPELPRSLWYEGHKSLDWFYDSWVNGKAVPSFQLTKVKITQLHGKTLVSGTIVEKDAPDELVTPVPIYAIQPKKQLIGQVFVDEQETQFKLTTPAGTQKIVLDPDHILLTRP
jgi:hypothetical protein